MTIKTQTSKISHTIQHQQDFGFVSEQGSHKFDSSSSFSLSPFYSLVIVITSPLTIHTNITQRSDMIRFSIHLGSIIIPFNPHSIPIQSPFNPHSTPIQSSTITIPIISPLYQIYIYISPLVIINVHENPIKSPLNHHEIPH